jgi:Xaa-Pro aminopeptidase
MIEQADRLAALRRSMAESDLDAVVIEQPENRRYLTGFTGSAGLALIGRDEARFITDSRYYEQVERQSPTFKLQRAGYETLEHLRDCLAELGATRVGFESFYVTVGAFRRRSEMTPDVDWVPLNGTVDRLRARKTPDEVKIIRRAAAMTDAAMQHAYDTAKAGMTERELAWALEVFMREQGADGLAFETIVAGGANGALPHHRPGDDVLSAGEPIVIDMGARVDGYNADLTRTFTLGPANDQDYAAVWELVRQANRAGVAAVVPGRSGREVDAAARDVIAQAGHGDHFGHGVGHGVGLNVHELPKVSSAGEEPLEQGMVVTIEPGVYLPGRFGVRIEDLVVVTASGAEVVSQAPTIAMVAR